MAEGGNVPELGGYDYEFTSRVPAHWECFVCHLTLKDPVQIVGCGHRLCKICMESLLRRPSPTCPADRQPLSRDKIFPDVACHRSILDLTVKCSNSGCSWTGELRAVEKHQSECLFKVVNCPNPGCTAKFTKRGLNWHSVFQCSWREINCEYCQEIFIMNQKQEHLDVCRKFPVQCTNKCCLKDIPREKLEVHVRDECPATEVQCEHKNLGCEAVFPRSNAKSHSESQVKSHLNLAIRGLETTQHGLETTQHGLETTQHGLETTQHGLETTQHGLETTQHGLEATQHGLEATQHGLEATQHQVRALVSLVEEQSQEMGRMMSKVKEQSEQIERMNMMMNCAPFLWKIPNFQAVYDRAVAGKEEVILSEPFYLSKHGYKLRIKLMPNGGTTSDPVAHNRIKGEFLSLYIKVVPGEYDSVLQWPFTDKVRVTLIDQDPRQDTRKNTSDVIKFSKGQWPRPRVEGDDGFGFREFLDQSTLRKGTYIKNNTIFVMASKD